MLFHRDRDVLEREFPQWQIERVDPMMPLRYLLSGGVSMRSLMPAAMYRPIAAAEKLIQQRGAMFAHIVLRRR